MTNKFKKIKVGLNPTVDAAVRKLISGSLLNYDCSRVKINEIIFYPQEQCEKHNMIHDKLKLNLSCMFFGVGIEKKYLFETNSGKYIKNIHEELCELYVFDIDLFREIEGIVIMEIHSILCENPSCKKVSHCDLHIFKLEDMKQKIMEEVEKNIKAITETFKNL